MSGRIDDERPVHVFILTGESRSLFAVHERNRFN